MIRTFRHKGLRQLFTKGSAKGVSVHLTGRLLRVLDALDGAESPMDLMVPGFGTHQLKGNREGTWAISISGNWRITFGFKGVHAVDVDLEDYH